MAHHSHSECHINFLRYLKYLPTFRNMVLQWRIIISSAIPIIFLNIFNILLFGKTLLITLSIACIRNEHLNMVFIFYTINNLISRILLKSTISDIFRKIIDTAMSNIFLYILSLTFRNLTSLLYWYFWAHVKLNKILMYRVTMK